jgi:hypothetical protein
MSNREKLKDGSITNAKISDWPDLKDLPEWKLLQQRYQERFRPDLVGFSRIIWQFKRVLRRLWYGDFR